MVCKTCYLCIQMKINKNLYLFLLVCAWRNYGNLQKKLRTVVTSGRDWVRTGLMEDRMVRTLFIEYLFTFFGFSTTVMFYLVRTSDFVLPIGLRKWNPCKLAFWPQFLFPCYVFPTSRSLWGFINSVTINGYGTDRTHDFSTWSPFTQDILCFTYPQRRVQT